jgi:hypothetical protein
MGIYLNDRTAYISLGDSSTVQEFIEDSIILVRDANFEHS